MVISILRGLTSPGKPRAGVRRDLTPASRHIDIFISRLSEIQEFVEFAMRMATDGSAADLERRRLQLEQNVSKLQTSLQHWQAWEIEYEGMKEDILGLGEHCSQTDLVQSLHRHVKVHLLILSVTGESRTKC